MQRRKDKKGKVLNAGEYQRKDGTYEYRWRENGKSYSVYNKDLTKLRKEEEDIIVRKAVQCKSSVPTLDKMFELWKVNKKGLKPQTLNNYVRMYEIHAKPVINSMLIS